MSSHPNGRFLGQILALVCQRRRDKEREWFLLFSPMYSCTDESLPQALPLKLLLLGSCDVFISAPFVSFFASLSWHGVHPERKKVKEVETPPSLLIRVHLCHSTFT